MLEPSGLAATIELNAVPALPGAVSLLRRGERSTFHAANRSLMAEVVVPPALAGRPEIELLFDPQTAGGLVLAVDPARAGALVTRLHEAGETSAAAIGTIAERAPDAPLLTLR
jgi:selenide,water dikinase